MNKIDKIELLRILSLPSGDPECDHSIAERALLDYVHDEDIKEAWEKAAKDWWYA